MRILVDPGSYDFSNLGCVAVLQMAVRRLCALWPQAVVQVLTGKPAEFALYCPEATPLSVSGHQSFLGDRLLGRAHRWMPPTLDRAISGMDDALRERWPDARKTVVRLKLGLQRRSARDLDAFCEALESSDLVVSSGLAGIRGSEVHALETLDLAIHREKPTAMFSLGLSGSHGPKQERRMKRVLPHVNLIALRERRTGPGILHRFGVTEPEVVVTGDDSVELANERRAAELGEYIGVNLRISRSFWIDDAVARDVAETLQSAAKRLATRLVPLPTVRDIARPDVEIAEAIAGNLAVPPLEPLDTPLAVINEVKRCRMVVTGRYHVAVFALAQGIPAVGIAGSPYVQDKLECLADQFGPGCVILVAREKNFRETLERAVGELWSEGQSLRPALLAEAKRQCEAGQSAYGRLRDFVSGSTTQ
jgi:colanic acid/amylovoran biosynthesis protein